MNLDNIALYQINLKPEWVKINKSFLKEYFNQFNKRISAEYKTLFAQLPTHLKNTIIDPTGGFIFDLNILSASEKKLFHTINNAYFGLPFFYKKSGLYISRGLCYYSNNSDNDDYSKWVKFFAFLDISVELCQSLSLKKDSFSYITWSLIDDVRYRLIIFYEYLLCEDVLKAKLMHKNIDAWITIFYNYALTGIIDVNIFNKTLQNISQFVQSYLSEMKKIQPELLRTYKEGDNPIEVILLGLKLKLMHLNPDLIIGIRFGGIELPFALKAISFQFAGVSFIKISKYSNQTTIKTPQITYPGKKILLVDDNILTGKTLFEATNAVLMNNNCEIYFACIGYSNMNRYYQMTMKNHGIINPLLLSRICVLAQSPFTTNLSTKSYTNKQGVFDKIKMIIKKRVNKTLI